MKLADKIKRYFRCRKLKKMMDEQEKSNPELKAARDKSRQGIAIDYNELILILENAPE